VFAGGISVHAPLDTIAFFLHFNLALPQSYKTNTPWGRGMTNDVAIGLSKAFLAELGQHVNFETEADVADFARDAMRVYADLGRLCRGEGQLMWRPKDGAARRLRLPTQSSDQT